MSPSRTALVTGASSGIGAAFADVFAENGFNVVLAARREERLRATAERLERTHGVRAVAIPCDLAAGGAVERLCAEMDRLGLTIDALVNAAGFGTAGTFMSTSWAEDRGMLQLAVTVPTELTHRLLPGMVDRRYGRIVNVASVAGLVASGAGTLYGASKTFAVSFSRLLAREVAPHGVHVTAVCPGLTRSGFHSRPDIAASVAAMPRWMWMEPDVVARAGYAAVMQGKRVVVTGRFNRLLVLALRTVPRPLVVAVGRRVVRVYRRLRARRI